METEVNYILCIQIVLDGHSGRSRGFGFIYFDTIDDAAEVGLTNEKSSF